MTVEEYLQLLERTADNVQRVGRPARTIAKETRGPRKKAGKALRGMKGAMKKAHARAKKKDGSFRKGWDQARLMKYAHKIRGK
tara:strand:- start:558 stop:806 length:249 start_codon:yes stop_codon:yes gene_type:complete